jgi:hypothetical protein
MPIPRSPTRGFGSASFSCADLFRPGGIACRLLFVDQIQDQTSRTGNVRQEETWIDPTIFQYKAAVA